MVGSRKKKICKKYLFSYEMKLITVIKCLCLCDYIFSILLGVSSETRVVPSSLII
jgi:hypothetical protein